MTSLRIPAALAVVLTSAVLIAGFPSPASAGSGRVTVLASLNSQGQKSAGADYSASVGGENGRYLAWDSTASNLVDNDDEGGRDVFLRDREEGLTFRASQGPDGEGGDQLSTNAAVSDNGRYVVYESSATNLVPNHQGFGTQVYAFDRETGLNTLISTSEAGETGDSHSQNPDISGDGRFVVYQTTAQNIVGVITARQIILRDRDLDDNGVFDEPGNFTNDVVSVNSVGTPANGVAGFPSISSNGRYVTFTSSAAKLVDGKTNLCDGAPCDDVFLHDRQTGITTRASLPDGVAASTVNSQANGDSGNGDVSENGRYVTFASLATNLVPGDNDDMSDVYVRDLQTGSTELVSKSTGGQKGNGLSYGPRISGDGSLITYGSDAGNLVANDTNGMNDIFLYDLTNGDTTIESVTSDGDPTSVYSLFPAISTDGSAIAFESVGNLVPEDHGDQDIYLRIVPSGPQLTQGDNDCDGDSDAVDALVSLQNSAGLPYNQQDPCWLLGDPIAPAAVPAGELPLFGDLDCDGDVDAVDALQILRNVAGLQPNQAPGCTPIGDPL